jgi:hypothetical protein
VSWGISANLGRYAPAGGGGRGWLWEISRGYEIARIVIEISADAWASDPFELPADTRQALETDGRTELLKLLKHDDPPGLVRCDVDGCTHSSV